MKLSATHITSILLTLEKAAAAIREIYETDFDANLKADGSFVTSADLASSKIISAGLAPFGIPIMSEEDAIPNYEIRKSWNSFWSVDPLDGTKGFVKKTDEFAINIALIENQQPVAGFIADPLNGKVIYGVAEHGVFLHEFARPKEDVDVSEVNLITNEPNLISWIRSRSVQTDIESMVKTMLPAETKLLGVSKGSALKFFDVALGKVDVYPRLLPSMEWDIAAGHAILNLLGGEIVALSTGEALTYNKKSLFNSNFIAKTSRFASKELVLNN